MADDCDSEAKEMDLQLHLQQVRQSGTVEDHQRFAHSNMKLINSLMAQEGKAAPIIDLEPDRDSDDSDNDLDDNIETRPRDKKSEESQLMRRVKRFRDEFAKCKNKQAQIKEAGASAHELFDLKPLENNSDKVWVTGHNGGPSVCVRTMLTLKAGQWISSDVINAYFWMIKRDYPDILVLPSFWWTLICPNDTFASYNYFAVSKWTKRKVVANRYDIFHYKQVFIPLNIHKNHWAHSIIDFHTCEFHLYDSLFQNDFYNEWKKVIQLFLTHEWKNKKQCNENVYNLDITQWQFCHHAEYPQQKNTYDCGVFLLTSAKRLALGQEILTDQTLGQMESRRVDILVDLLNGCLTTM